MAVIKIDKFGGLMPRLHPSLLPDGMATVAHNLRLKNGKLVPLRQPLKLAGNIVNLEGGFSQISDAHTLFAWKHDEWMEFLAFEGYCDVAEGNLADDEFDRVFVTGQTGMTWHDTSVTPSKTYHNVPVAYMRSGTNSKIIRHPLVKATLPRPYAKLAKQTVSDTSNIRYTRFYQTWVDPYGYESGVSNPSYTWSADAGGAGVEGYIDDDLQYNDGDEINISALSSADIPEGGGTLEVSTPGFKRRIYKVITGAEGGGRSQLIAEISTAVWGNITIRVKDEDAGEVMPDVESIPTDLQNMIYVPGDFYAGFSTSHPKTVMFSDVGIPTSWPSAFRYDVEDRIVALATNTNSVFVLTDGYPFVVSGTAPESMSVAKLAGIAAACVSKRSVCLVKNACCYASNIGICMIAPDADYGTIVQNITDKFFTKDQWRALEPETCLMGQFDGALHAFFPSAGKAYIVDLQENGKTMVTEHDEMATCLCTDSRTDELYFVRSGEEV